MFRSVGNSLIVQGLLALAVGVIAVAWPGVTVLALVIMFAVYAFVEAATQLTLAFRSARTKPVIGHLLGGLVDIAAGAIALAWPGATALVLVLLVGSWAIVTGIIEFAAAFRSGEMAGTRAMFIVGSLGSVAFGVVLFARPDMGAITPRPAVRLVQRHGRYLDARARSSSPLGGPEAARTGRASEDPRGRLTRRCTDTGGRTWRALHRAPAIASRAPHRARL